jgi:hypothetical protein
MAVVEGYWAGGRRVVSRIESLLVVIPVTSLVLAGLLVMVLATVAEAPRLSSDSSSSDANEELGEMMAHLGPDFFP